MTADLDLSPEAVERLAKRHALHVSSKYPTAATLRALSAELAAARAENELMAKAIDEREIASGLSTNGGFWRWWAAQARDTAAKLDAARAENYRLRAERDAAWQAGAEAMRAKATDRADEIAVSMFVQQTGGAAQYFANRSDMAEFIARAIRALPIPDKEGET